MQAPAFNITQQAGSSDSTASIKNLPVSLFGAVMGLSGLALAWKVAHGYLGISPVVSDVLGLIAMLTFILLAIAYAVKVALYPSTVLAEFRHPVAGNFFATIAISMLLLSAIMSPYSLLCGQILWTLGSIMAFLLGFIITGRLLEGSVDPANAVPAWLISGVATLDIAVTGSDMPMLWAREMTLAALAIGSVLALIFYVLIMHRLIHQQKMAKGLAPSMMIMLAPFAVGFLAYVNVFGRIDAFASLLFYFGLFAFLVISPKVFRRENSFHAGWWAISFPMAALSSAALKYSSAHTSTGLLVMSIMLLAVLSLAILILAFRTLHIVFNGKLFRP